MGRRAVTLGPRAERRGGGPPPQAHEAQPQCDRAAPGDAAVRLVPRSERDADRGGTVGVLGVVSSAPGSSAPIAQHHGQNSAREPRPRPLGRSPGSTASGCRSRAGRGYASCGASATGRPPTDGGRAPVPRRGPRSGRRPRHSRARDHAAGRCRRDLGVPGDIANRRLRPRIGVAVRRLLALAPRHSPSVCYTLSAGASSTRATASRPSTAICSGAAAQ